MITEREAEILAREWGVSAKDILAHPELEGSLAVFHIRLSVVKSKVYKMLDRIFVPILDFLNRCIKFIFG